MEKNSRYILICETSYEYDVHETGPILQVRGPLSLTRGKGLAVNTKWNDAGCLLLSLNSSVLITIVKKFAMMLKRKKGEWEFPLLETRTNTKMREFSMMTI